VVALLLGSLMLVRTDSVFDIVTISWKVVVIAVLFTAFFFLVIIGLGIRAQKKKPTTGIQGIIGEYGETLTVLDPDGRIRIHGESWSAKSLEGRIEPGSRVLAEGLDRLTLLVRKVST